MPRNKKNASRKQKQQAHQNLDILWQANFTSPSEKQSLRSLIYQLFAAVILGEEDIFTAEGIRDPFAGGHHIAQLPPAYHPTLRSFIKHILFDKNNGNTNRLSAWLIKWHSPLVHIKDLVQIADYVKKDPAILSIRQNLGLELPSKVIPKMPKPGLSDANQKLIPELTPEDSVDEPNPEELKDDGLKLAPEDRKPSSMQDIFIDAILADINGQEDKALALYNQAADMGYEESKVTPEENSDAPSLQSDIRNSLYRNILSSLLKLSPKILLKYTKKFAESKVPQAMYNLSYYYQTGRDMNNTKVTRVDLAESASLLKQAADLGHDMSQRIIGLRYIAGEVMQKDVPQGIKYLKLAASQGDTQAMHNLAILYYAGQNAEKDLETAVQYWKEAVDQGYNRSQKDFALASKELGKNLLNGTNDFEQDYVKAVKFLKYAANIGDPEAQYLVATCYYKGQGVDRDLQQSVRFYELAVRTNPAVQKELNFVKAEMQKAKTQEFKPPKKSKPIQTTQEFSLSLIILERKIPTVNTPESLTFVSDLHGRCQEFYTNNLQEEYKGGDDIAEKLANIKKFIEKNKPSVNPSKTKVVNPDSHINRGL